MRKRILVSLVTILFLLSGGSALAKEKGSQPKKNPKEMKKQKESNKDSQKERKAKPQAPKKQKAKAKADLKKHMDRNAQQGSRQGKGLGKMGRQGQVCSLCGRSSVAPGFRGMPGQWQGLRQRMMSGARRPGSGMQGRGITQEQRMQWLRKQTNTQRGMAPRSGGAMPDWRVMAYRNGWRPGPQASQKGVSPRQPKAATPTPQRPGSLNSKAGKAPAQREAAPRENVTQGERETRRSPGAIRGQRSEQQQ